MNDLIKSLKKRILALDKESIKRDLTEKEKKQKENLKYEIYWAKFKKFKAAFERLVITDVKELSNSLKTPLLQKNILLINEMNIINTRKNFRPDLPVYMIISICDKSLGMNKRWENSPFLLLKGNHEKDTIELYDCNQDLNNVSDYIKKNVWGSPIEKFLIDKYKFTLLKPHIEKWLNRNVDRILHN